MVVSCLAVAVGNMARLALEPPQVSPYRAAGGRRVAPPPLRAADAATLNWEYSVILSQARTFRIGFRSDTRSYEDLVRCQGFNARARQSGWVRTGYAMNQRWNPFNNPVYSESLFLRLGEKNKDACLHTVVSSGANFHEVVHFPILNDYGNNFKAVSANGQYLAVKPGELWTDADIQLAADDRMKVRAVKSTTGPGVDHVERDSHVHVFHATGLRGYDTGAHFGGSFRERSMYDIPVANLLADLPFVQKWWYDPVKERQIIFYDVEFAPIRWVPSEQAVEALLGEAGIRQLREAIEREIGKARGRAQDVVPNRAAYEKYQREKATMLSASEKEQVFEKLGDYIGSVRAANNLKYAPDRKKELARVIADLPALKAKLEKTDPSQWADIRKETMRLRKWV